MEVLNWYVRSYYHIKFCPKWRDDTGRGRVRGETTPWERSSICEILKFIYEEEYEYIYNPPHLGNIWGIRYKFQF
jgi:hypothetical protein